MTIPLNEQDYTEALAEGRRGILRLTFANPRLEKVFHAYLLRHSLPYMRFGLVIIVIFILVSLVLNVAVFRTTPDTRHWFRLIFGGSAVTSLIMLGYLARERTGVLVERLSLLSTVSTGMVFTPLIRYQYALNGVPYPYLTEAFVSVILFALSGLRFRVALLTGLGTLLGMILTERALKYPGREMASSIYNTACIGAMAMAAGFAREFVLRRNFLFSRLNQHRAEHDPLTGLHNRRGLEERLTAVWQQAAREERGLAVAMIDVDYFKRYNDTQGHQAGDVALRRVAEAIDHEVARRPLDLAGRFGGEEFIIVWYDVGVAEAARLAERLRAAVAAMAIPHPAGVPGKNVLTVSVGCASAHPAPSLNGSEAIQQGLDRLAHAADMALYQAKSAGRDRVSTVGVSREEWEGLVLTGAPATAGATPAIKGSQNRAADAPKAK